MGISREKVQELLFNAELVISWAASNPRSGSDRTLFETLPGTLSAGFWPPAMIPDHSELLFGVRRDARKARSAVRERRSCSYKVERMHGLDVFNLDSSID